MPAVDASVAGWWLIAGTVRNRSRLDAPQRQDGDVVIARAIGGHPRHDSFGNLVGAAGHREQQALEARDPGLEACAPLDETVGVEKEGRAAGKRDLCCAVP